MKRTILSSLLRWDFLRRRLVFSLKQDYYGDLDIRVPVGGGIYCPVLLEESWWSFSEIFIERQYDPALAAMPLPGRWLDLGCHAGFFSLLLVALIKDSAREGDFSALLVDADSRMRRQVERLVAINSLSGKLCFVHGAIAPGEGETRFLERSHMDSCLATPSDPGGIPVPIISENDILGMLAPPYDLVKVDLEGGEHGFLSAYGQVIAQSERLLIEWHSWHAGGGGAEQVSEMASLYGFRQEMEVMPPRDVLHQGVKAQCGITLYRRAGRNGTGKES